MNSKVLSLMGFAQRARKIQSGYNTSLSAMEKGRAALLILAEDLAENSREKMIRKAEQYKVEYRIYGDSEEMSHITGQSVKSIFVITDENFKKSILNAIDCERTEDTDVVE